MADLAVRTRHGLNDNELQTLRGPRVSLTERKHSVFSAPADTWPQLGLRFRHIDLNWYASRPGSGSGNEQHDKADPRTLDYRTTASGSLAKTCIVPADDGTHDDDNDDDDSLDLNDISSITVWDSPTNRRKHDDMNSLRSITENSRKRKVPGPQPPARNTLHSSPIAASPRAPWPSQSDAGRWNRSTVAVTTPRISPPWPAPGINPNKKRKTSSSLDTVSAYVDDASERQGVIPTTLGLSAERPSFGYLSRHMQDKTSSSSTNPQQSAIEIESPTDTARTDIELSGIAFDSLRGQVEETNRDQEFTVQQLDSAPQREQSTELPEELPRALPARTAPAKTNPFPHEDGVSEIRNLTCLDPTIRDKSSSPAQSSSPFKDRMITLSPNASPPRALSPRVSLPSASRKTPAKTTAKGVDVVASPVVPKPGRKLLTKREQMLVDSKRADASRVQSSDDELAGPCTVHTAAKRRVIAKPSTKKKDTSSSIDRFGRSSIGLEALHTSTLGGSAKRYPGLALSYCAKEYFFHVVTDDGVVCTNDNRAVRLTATQLRTPKRNEDGESFKVSLKGAADDDLGNGHVLIEAVDKQAYEQFLAALTDMNVMHACRHVAAHQLDGVWRNFKQPTECLHVLKDDKVDYSVRDRRRPSIQEKEETLPRETRSEPRKIDMPSDLLPNEYSGRSLVDEPRKSLRTKRPTTRASDADQFEDPALFNRWSHSNKIPRLFPVTFPVIGARRATVTADDVPRLDDGEFFNDNLISFCLRKLEDDHPELKSSVHFFNTFFYSALTSKDGKRGFNYEAVKKWTKKVDLFGCDYAIVPVNVNMHWFVAIICNLPNLSRATLVDQDDGSDVAPPASFDLKETVESSVAANDDLESMTQEVPPSQGLEQLSLESGPVESPEDNGSLPSEVADSEEERIRIKTSRIEATQDTAVLATRKSSEPVEEFSRVAENFDGPDIFETVETVVKKPPRKPTKKPNPPVRTADPDSPLVITLDSLGAAHVQEIRMLKEYIVAEGMDKRGLSVDQKSIRGWTAKGIPEQSNHCDCGVFVVGYVESFLKNPRGFVEKICSRKSDSNNDMFLNFDPSQKRCEIREMLFALGKEQNGDGNVKTKA